MRVSRSILPSLFLLSFTGGCAHQAASTNAASTQHPPELRLYALDCGRIDIHDMGFFTDGSQPNGQRGEMSVPCFLIRHPQGALLWDTGLDDVIAQSPDGVADPIGPRYFVQKTLHAQLAQLGLKPSDVRYVGFSHLHADHAGNANAFIGSTWLLQRKELTWATATPAPLGVDPTKFSTWRDAKVEPLDGDRDVFGDGSVRILFTPGHTPGHQSLQVNLPRTGTVVLSGDLCHTRANWEHHGVPGFNTSREETLSSINHVEALVKDSKGRFVVQHAPEDFRALPAFPSYLE
ncbi:MULTISPECIES: N-acyl homoserine lactonase family protein [unclassified Myxococcus]|uniref:N-acyl homoserine lactonase family protein n=1 Tax=unclassified Myxococcus TaxID=2648731 RepID=UPI00157ADEC4|nr:MULTISPECIES: N-acyl homoserine lactonase family protein [unclassified Myxococcus]NTX36700.1 N-acyl homoserine lactonase family protein [Myxococcus sp. CA033]NTX53289.1 N-acyl homoserine lactonase family protein [Myxococcus sp. CA039A]